MKAVCISWKNTDVWEERIDTFFPGGDTLLRLDREMYVLRYFALDGYSIQGLTELLLSALMLSNVVPDIRIRIELAAISGDSLVLRGSPGPQGQPPKERCVSSSILLL